MIKCGLYETDITPVLGLSIPGYFHERLGSGVKDNLYARSLAIDNGEKVLVIVNLDCIFVNKAAVDAIRERITGFVGISVENIMVSATHTHTGGPINAYSREYSTEYMEFLVKRAADSAIMAFNGRREARIGFGSGYEDSIAFNRRYYMKDGTIETNPTLRSPLIDRPAGPIDPEVMVIRIDDVFGNPMGVVTNYACHADTIDGTEYSADYMGELSRQVKNSLGQHVVSMFLTGPCGNINHIDIRWDTGRPVGHYKKMGRILAGEVLKTREKINTVDNLELQVMTDVITAQVRRPSDADAEKAREVLASIPERKVDYWDVPQVERYFAKSLLNIYESDERTADIDIKVARIGDLCITCMPCELFVEFGLEIKGKSPAKYNIISTLTNGANGYVAVREAFEKGKGGYEAKISSGTKLGPDTGYQMAECAMNMINGIWKWNLTDR